MGGARALRAAHQRGVGLAGGQGRGGGVGMGGYGQAGGWRDRASVRQGGWGAEGCEGGKPEKPGRQEGREAVKKGI